MPKPFDLLSEFGKFGIEQKISLRDPVAKSAFGEHVASALDNALADHALLHGQRASAMFEALLVSLGEYRLLKAEDTGRVFPIDYYRVPDFRVVLKDGEQWLVEVKNVYQANPIAQSRKLMTLAYRQSLEAYATATGAKLKLAVYWARWSLWTLVSPEMLIDERGDLVLDMTTAMMANEFGRLGDRTIGTRPPLSLRFNADPDKPSFIDDDGLANMVIKSVQILSDGEEVTDPDEKEIAWIFMQYGEWWTEGLQAVIEDERLIGIEMLWGPREQHNDGFEFIGSLSRMFAGYFTAHTMKDDAVVQIQAPLRPNWFSPLISATYKSKMLPLWQFILQPARIG